MHYISSIARFLAVFVSRLLGLKRCRGIYGKALSVMLMKTKPFTACVAKYRSSAFYGSNPTFESILPIQDSTKAVVIHIMAIPRILSAGA